MPKKNVLLITCDQLRRDALGFSGNHVVKTPNLDALASDARVFTGMFAANPVCSPNRAAIATGRMPSICGMPINGCVLPKTELTMMEVFRRHDYKTFGIGKMHFEPEFEWDLKNTSVPGIDNDNMTKIAASAQPKLWETPYYGFDEAHIVEDMRVGPYNDFLHEHGLDAFDDPHSWTYPQDICRVSAYPKELHHSAWIADRTIECLTGTDEPFFCWTSFVDPHHPFTPPAPYDTMYNPDDMPLPSRREGEMELLPEKLRRRFYATGGSHEAVGLCNYTDHDYQLRKAYYYGMISMIDEQVGRIVDALRRAGKYDDTVIVFTSDHGELLGDHGFMFKGIDFDCVTNVPFFVANAGLTPSVDTELRSSVDVMPTILECAGMKPPKRVQGRSALTNPGRDAVLIENQTAERAVRTADRLYVYDPGQDGMLFDLESDPNCLENLWNNPARAGERLRFAELLAQLLAQNIDPEFERRSLC